VRRQALGYNPLLGRSPLYGFYMQKLITISLGSLRYLSLA
jgi:hypothetical protein